MGIFRNFNVKFDNNDSETPHSQQDSRENLGNQQLDRVQKEIDDLKNSGDVIDIKGVLNKEFADYLKNKSDIARQLLDAVNGINNVEGGSHNGKAINDLKAFLEPIVNPATIKGSMEDPNETGGSFYEKNLESGDNAITKNIVEGKISTLLTSIGEQQDGENENIASFRNIINNIKKVLENPTSENTKKLQKFLLANLDNTDFSLVNLGDNYIDRFLRQNFKNGNPDGLFGQNTLNGVYAFVNKLDNYIKSIRGAEDVMNRNAQGKGNDVGNQTVDVFEGVTLKTEIDIPTEGEIKPGDLFEGTLPEGVTVTFKDGNSIDKGKTEEQEVTIVLTKENVTPKEIPLIVQIEDDKLKIKEKEETINDQGAAPQSATPEVVPQSTAPLELNGEQHQVVTLSSPLSGVTLYSLNATQGLTAGDNGYETLSFTPSQEGDTEFLAKLNNFEGVYKVKIDSQGNLCPVATNDNGDKVLFENNSSCISYLQSKIPGEIRSSGITIEWNNRVRDYVLTSYDRTLTIEPMTIAGDWISKDLSKNLAFLNLTNYIRDIGVKGGNPDPNITDEYRIKGIRDGNGKKVFIRKEDFGLGRATPDELSKFKKYNNHEQWEDNWDKKKPNRYSTIDLSSASVTAVQGAELQGSPELGQSSPRGVVESVPTRTVEINQNLISPLQLEKVTDISMLNGFDIPADSVVYKSSTEDKYYFKQGENVVCIKPQYPDSKWKKWIINTNNTNNIEENEVINVCDSGKKSLNSILSQSLAELPIEDSQRQSISIIIEDNNYKFMNGDNEFTIFQEILKSEAFCGITEMNDKLRLLYLISNYVPSSGKFELQDDGSIKNGSDKIISSEDLKNYKVSNDYKADLVNYLNRMSSSDSDNIVLGQAVVTGRRVRGAETSVSEEIINNLIVGDGNISFKDGVEKTDEKGTYIDINGVRYYKFSDGMEGLGYRSTSQYLYVGKFKNGKFDGVGEWVTLNGTNYKGTRKDGLKDGNGVETWPNGRYNGEFKGGKYDGLGTLIYFDGMPSSVKYEGVFGEGSMIGGNITLGGTNSFLVNRDDFGLKIVSGEDSGKYFDEMTHKIGTKEEIQESNDAFERLQGQIDPNAPYRVRIE